MTEQGTTIQVHTKPFPPACLAVIMGAVLTLGACRSSTPPGGASQASPTPVTPTAVTTTSSPTPETLDGTWEGSTSEGDDFSFTVSGNKINHVALPAAQCGAGFASTVNQKGGFTFKGRTFKVTTLGFPYTIYPKSGGPGTSAEDSSIITGTFSSSTNAAGTITTKVQTSQGTTDQCRVRWTASKA